MLITKVIRSYSKSINARNYGAPEAWVKIEATYEAQCESSDNPMEVSKMLYDQCKKEVIEGCNEVITKMKEANAAMKNGIANAVGGSTAAPLTPSPAGSSVTGGPRSL